MAEAHTACGTCGRADGKHKMDCKGGAVEYPMGTLYVEFSLSVPEFLAPEYNGGPKGRHVRRVELFRDGTGGVVAVVPKAESVEQALDLTHQLIRRGYDAHDIPDDVPQPWQTKIIYRDRMEAHFLEGEPRTGEYLTDDMLASSKREEASK